MFGLSISKDGDIDNLDEGVGETDTETLWRPFVIKFKTLYGQPKLLNKLYKFNLARCLNKQISLIYFILQVKYF